MKAESINFSFPMYTQSLSASNGVTGSGSCTPIETLIIDSLFEKLFCSESKAFQIDGVVYTPIEPELFNDIKRAFNDFGPLALKQFEFLQKHLGEAKIFIGQINKFEFQQDTRIGVDRQGLFKNENIQYVGINLTREVIEQQMDKYLFVMELKNTNDVEVKAIKFRDLVNGDIAKLGTFLLFHELFHVNSFAEKGFDPNKYKEHCQNFDKNFSSTNILNDIKILFKADTTEGEKLCDDALNTIDTGGNTGNRCPGEFELLNHLHLPYSLRLYRSSNLNFSEQNVKEACLNVYKSVFNITTSNLIIDKNNVELVQKENYEKNSAVTYANFMGPLSKEDIEAITLQDTNL